MNFIHGKDFDCGNEECRLCKVWREKDREEWESMNLEERKKVSWGYVGTPSS